MSLPGTGGKLIFNQDFTTQTSLDTSVWHPSWFSEATMNGVTTDPANVSVVNGQLVLTLASATSGALVNTNPATASKGFLYTYGYAEASITFPSVNGHLVNWPAFWTECQDWENGGESDIAEVLNSQMTTNYHYRVKGVDSPQSSGPIAGNWTGKHRYGMLWTPGLQAIYFDGVLVHTRTTNVTTAPQYLILNIGNGQGNAIEVGGKVLVDYVRVWQ